MKLKNYLSRILFFSLFFSLINSPNTFRYTFAQETKIEKKKLTPINWARSRKIDIKHIALDLKFDWIKKQAYGTAAISFSPFNSTNNITLDAAFFTINSITSQKEMPLKFEYAGGDQNDNLKIYLDQVYQRDEETTIKIDYQTNWINLTDPNNLSGSSGKGIRFFEPTSNDLNRPREIWSIGEPESNRYWFPSYDSPNDLRTTEFKATVDNNLTAISNGVLVSTKDNPDGTHTFYWKANIPYANHLTSFVVGEYVDIKQNYENIDFHSFGYPNEKEAIKASTVRLSDMAKFFSEVTGVKYPYPTYSQVFVQDSPGAVGSNALSTITENMIDDDRTHADFFYLWDLTEAEMLASQWFGNYISCRDWSQIWLNKSFAHYFNGIYNEHKNGKDEFLLFQHLFDINSYLNDWNSGNRRPVITQKYENIQTFTEDNYSTGRGTLVLHMLRKHLGEENWWKAIKHYVKSNGNKLVSTQDFCKAVEETTGESMDWFFDQWLYKMGHPIFEITKSYDGTKKQLILNVKQLQKIDPTLEYAQVELFQGKIDIEIDGEIKQIWLKPKEENIFSFVSTEEPKLINFDYENTWIKEISFEKTLDELLYQLKNDKDTLGKRWAIDQLANIAKNEKTSLQDKTRIYTGFRDTILSKSYWRLRLSALQQLQNLLAPSTETNPIKLDEATTSMLLTVIKNEGSWNRAGAINFLGMTRNPEYAGIYFEALNDISDRVISTAATALGKCKHPKAFDALAKLVEKPSWKNQSLMSALTGLRHLGDPRGFDIAFKALSDPYLLRWRLPTPPVWDFRVVAIETIVSLGKADATYPLIFEQLKKSMDENDINGIFNNMLLIIKLADSRGQEAFKLLKLKFKNDPYMLSVINTYEEQFLPQNRS